MLKIKDKMLACMLVNQSMPITTTQSLPIDPSTIHLIIQARFLSYSKNIYEARRQGYSFPFFFCCNNLIMVPIQKFIYVFDLYEVAEFIFKFHGMLKTIRHYVSGIWYSMV